MSNYSLKRQHGISQYHLTLYIITSPSPRHGYKLPCRNDNVADYQYDQHYHRMGDGVPHSHGTLPLRTNTEYSSVRIPGMMIYSAMLLHDGHIRHYPEGG